MNCQITIASSFLFAWKELLIAQTRSPYIPFIETYSHLGLQSGWTILGTQSASYSVENLLESNALDATTQVTERY